MRSSKWILFAAMVMPAILLPEINNVHDQGVPIPPSYTAKTITFSNQAAFALLVIPDMEWLPKGAKQFEGRPLSAIIPSKGLGVAFTYPVGLEAGAVYLLTPKAVSAYQKSNPGVTTFDPGLIYNWIIATGKGANDGVHIILNPAPSLTIYSDPDESNFRVY